MQRNDKPEQDEDRRVKEWRELHGKLNRPANDELQDVRMIGKQDSRCCNEKSHDVQHDMIRRADDVEYRSSGLCSMRLRGHDSDDQADYHKRKQHESQDEMDPEWSNFRSRIRHFVEESHTDYCLGQDK